VAEQLVTFLIGFIHLTLSFDGWSSKGGAEIYTVHITTPLRQSYLVDGLMLTGLSTDGQNLFSLISEVSAHRQYSFSSDHCCRSSYDLLHIAFPSLSLIQLVMLRNADV
jgi:hypothetical protein